MRLIVAQSADGSLVVGDSHHCEDAACSPFQDAAVEQRILRHLSTVLNVPAGRVVERWTGVFPVALGGNALIESPAPSIRLVLVTSGTGMSTSFALAEETLGATW
jgi:glycine/D-amino acid oxidase-like deaminating enzyme